MINHYPVDEIIRETYCAIRRIEIYLVDSAICLLHDWNQIDNDDQAIVSEIKHSVSNPPRKLAWRTLLVYTAKNLTPFGSYELIKTQIASIFGKKLKFINSFSLNIFFLAVRPK